MARTSAFLVLVVLALPCFAQLAVAARKVPAVADQAADATEATRRGTLQEGTVLIPGIGRYMFGSHNVPDLTGLDHSIPAATHSQYLPGADDTFVPNPGFEIPNPFRPAAGSP